MLPERPEPALPFLYWTILDNSLLRRDQEIWYFLNCMASRTFYLATANPVEADSFLKAFWRSIARRGPVRHLRSDQSKLVGKQLDDESLGDPWQLTSVLQIR